MHSLPNKDEIVHLQYSRNIGKHSVAVTMVSEDFCYEWSQSNGRKRKDGTERITFICSAGRSLRDGKEVAKNTGS